jgi:ribosome recycling factor
MCQEMDDMKKKFAENIIGILKQVSDKIDIIANDRVVKDSLDNILIKKHNKIEKLKDLAYIKYQFPKVDVVPISQTDMEIIKKCIKKSDVCKHKISISFEKDRIKIIIMSKTSENRLEVLNHIKKICENYKISLRNNRRHFNTSSKSYFKKNKIAKDIQNKHNTFSDLETSVAIKNIDTLLLKYEKKIKNV